MPQHEALLAASGIAPEVATARGYRSADTKAALGRLGFSSAQRSVPALLVPVWSVVTKEIVFYQSRPDDPRVTQDGKRIRYETPSRVRMVLDAHPLIYEKLGDPAVSLWITEGVRKADAAVTRGLCCIALLGVWNWRGRNDHGGTTALADWEHIALNDRRVYIVFDSDVMIKPEVHAAVGRLKAFLESRGARVALIYLPSGEGGAKVGLDDFFAAGHTVQDLLVLSTSKVRGPVADVPAAAPSAAPSDPMPWPEPVGGAALVEGLAGFFSRYAVLPLGGALVLGLWAVGTWLIGEFDAFPYLAVTSPQRECGKSLVLKLLGCLCRRPLSTANISEAALFRVIEREAPALLIDEAQRLRVRDERSAALHDLLCAGYQRGAFVYRMAGANRDELRRFGVFCAKAVGLIGRMTDVLMDRAIEIRMRRRTRTERIDRFFLTRPPAEAEPLRRQVLRWTTDHRREVREAYLTSPLPDWLQDREAELWSPLLAVACVASPSRMAEVEGVARALAGAKAAADDSIGVRLLSDLRAIFGDQEFLPTREVLDALVAIEDAPWSEYRAGRPLTPRGLAELLSPFEVEPGKARHGEQVGVRGYFREAFRDAFDRYIPSSEAFNPPQAPQAKQDKGLRPIYEAPQTPLVADGKIAANARETSVVAAVADKSAQEGGGAERTHSDDSALTEAVRRWGPPIEVRSPNGDRRAVGDDEGRRIYLLALRPDLREWIDQASTAEIEAAVQATLVEEEAPA